MPKEENKEIYEELDVDNSQELNEKNQKNQKKFIGSKIFSFFLLVSIIGSIALLAYNEVSQKDNLLNEQKGVSYVLKLEKKGKHAYQEYENKVYDGKLKNYLKSKSVMPINIIDLKENPKYEPALQVTFDLGNSGLTYEVGDTIGIFPKNDEEKVEAFAKIMGYNLDDVVTYDIKGKLNEKTKLPYPNGYTVRQILTELIDLNGFVTKKMLLSLIDFVESSEKQKIEQETKNETLYKNKKYNILDICEKFKTLKIPFEKIHIVFQYIKPRLYTVASSPNRWKNKFNIAITLVSWFNSKNQEVFGLNSAYLKKMRQTKNLQQTKIIINKGSFKLPEDKKTPILMICTGSGIAPFISFLEELKFRGDSGRKVWLIFGSKTRKSDFLYEKELMSFKSSGILTDVITAFSRDQAYKIYVQDRLKEEFGGKLEQLMLNEKMKIYVCGAGSMGKRIKDVIKSDLGDEKYEQVMEQKQFIGEFWENK